jgi:hypothetical protein
MTVKRFRSGSGRLDANNLNKMVQAVQTVERFPAQGQHFRPRWYGPIVCKIISSLEQDSARKYRYTIKEILFTSFFVFTEADGGFESDRAINLAERDNSVDQWSGIPSEDFPGTFTLRPTPNDAIVSVYVGSNGDATYPNTVWFDRPGEFFGACPSP